MAAAPGRARTAGASAAQGAAQPDARPDRRAEAARFRVLTARDLQARARRRRARAVAAVAGTLLIGSLLAIAIAQALVASQQIRLDSLEQRLAAAVATNQELQLQRAELASPARILDLAKRELGMITPGDVTYLPAVAPSRLGSPHAPPRAASVSRSGVTSTVTSIVAAAPVGKIIPAPGRKRP